MVRHWIALAMATLFAACAVAARADIASVGGGIQVRAPVLTTDTGGDNVLEQDEYQSDSQIRVWFERTLQTSATVTLDHVVTTSAGTGTVAGNGSLNSGTIAAGTRVDSYYLRFDPVTNNTRLSDSSGSLSITFDTDILGLAMDNNGIVGSAAGLDETDDGTTSANGQAFEGPGAMTYKNAGSRGFELGTSSAGDRFSISSNRRTITILNVFANGTDDLRIFVVAAVPEPAALSLFGAGALGMYWMLRKRRRAAAKTGVRS